MGFDSYIDIFRDKYNVAIGMKLGKSTNHPQNLVVRFSCRKPRNGLNGEWLSLKKESACGVGMPDAGKRYAVGEAVTGCFGKSPSERQ